METNISFRFGDLTPEVQEEIIQTNKLPTFVFVDYKGLHLCFEDRNYGFHGQRKFLEDDTRLYVVLSEGITSESFEWLKEVPCSMSMIETFYGYIPNGLFRYGPARAEVSSFDRNLSKTEWNQASDMDFEVYSYQILATKVIIRGEGLGGNLITAGRKLYRLIRKGQMSERHVIERWPVQVPPALVTIGASTSDPVENR